MTASLYPQWGSGTKPFKQSYKVFSFKSINRQDLNAGDKIILPERSLKEIKRLRLPFPFVFEIRRGNCVDFWQEATRDLAKQKKPRQFCSVFEFSGKKSNEMFIPHWMMKNLRVKSGQKVSLRSALKIVPGESVTLEPEKSEFFELISDLGPQAFLESAMKNYSVLSLNERLLIRALDKNYYVKIVKSLPKNVISILGDVDLNIDFQYPDGIEPVMAPKKKNTENSAEVVESIPSSIQELEQEEKEVQVHSDADLKNPFSVLEEEPEPQIVIDQETPELRRKRMREAALARFQNLSLVEE